MSVSLVQVRLEEPSCERKRCRVNHYFFGRAPFVLPVGHGLPLCRSEIDKIKQYLPRAMTCDGCQQPGNIVGIAHDPHLNDFLTDLWERLLRSQVTYQDAKALFESVRVEGAVIPALRDAIRDTPGSEDLLARISTRIQGLGILPGHSLQ